MRKPPVVLAVLATIVALAACSSTGGGTPKALATAPTALPSFTAPAGSSTDVSAPPTSPSASSSKPDTPSPHTPSPHTTPTPSVIVKPPPSTPLHDITVTSTDGKRSYEIKIWVDVQGRDCADNAYGTPVIQYLTAHPCTGLTRLLATTVVNGRPVAFAQSSLGFLGTDPQVYTTAGDFATLVNADGTGNIADLFRDGYRVPNGPARLPQPDAFNVQSQDSGVTIVDAFYLDGSTPTNSPALIRMAQDIYLQF